MPSKIIADINPADPNDIPDSANQFVFNNDPNDQTPLFTFMNSLISAHELIEATDLLQPKKSQDMNGISMSFIKNPYSVACRPSCPCFLMLFIDRCFPVPTKNS
jgi:hypothetical protein